MANERYFKWDGPYPKGRKEELLWPVEVWAISAPDYAKRLNLFQEAMLGVLRAGIRDIEEVSSTLCLDQNLVAFILEHELIPNGWVDETYAVTASGEDFIRSGTDRDNSVSTQFVFRDAVFGTWIPRVCSELPEINPVELSGGTYPVFLTSRDDGRQVRPFLLPRRARPEPPKVGDIVDAWKAFLEEVPPGDRGEQEVPQMRSDDITVISRDPSLAYVWCEIVHLPGDRHPWLVTDPWRQTQAAKWLREPLQDGLSTFQGLAERVRRVLPEADPSAQSAEAFARQIERDVDLQIMRWPKLNHARMVLLRDQLAMVLRQKAWVSSGTHATQEDLSNLMQLSVSLLEALLKWMLEIWPLERAGWPHEGRNRSAAESLLRALPAGLALPGRCRSILAGQSFRDIRLAAIHRDRSFKALLFAALLATHDHESHPLRRASQGQTRWEEIFILVDARNKGSHATGRSVTREEALDGAELAIEWVESFSGYF